MRSTVLTLGGLAMMMATSPAMSIDTNPATYLLTMQMHDGDRLVASPSMKVAAAATSAIEIGNAADNHYSMSVTIKPQGADTVTIKSVINVLSSGRHQTVAPTMLVALNKPSAIAFGEDSATSKPFRVDFTIRKLT